MTAAAPPIPVEVDVLSFSKLFEDSPFPMAVDNYQRGFVWNDDKIRQMVDDLAAYQDDADPKPAYYMGAILLHRNKDKQKHFIIDGQQRLTALCVLHQKLTESLPGKCGLTYSPKSARRIRAAAGIFRDHDRRPNAEIFGQIVFTETPRKLIERESHNLWGRRHLLTVVHQEAKPFVSLDHRRITLTVRPGSDVQKRAEVLHEWHKSLLHELVPALIQKWETKLHVKVAGYFLQRMKTKWGSCNHKARHIRLNTELVKKPKDLLEYVIVHEMIHLSEPTHNDRFIAILGEHYPTWREARAELNDLPLAAEAWKE